MSYEELQTLELTPEQKALIPAWVGDWIAKLRSTEPADRDRFVEGASRAYDIIGYEFPKRVVWADNPLVMALAAPAATYALDNPDAEGVVKGEPKPNGLEDFSSEITDGVLTALAEATNGQIAVDYTNPHVRDHVARTWVQKLPAEWNSAWFMWVLFLRDLGIDVPQELVTRAEAYQLTDLSAGWWTPDTNFVMVCERPHALHMKSERLDCETGPAIAWKGWELYYLDGLAVPEKVVMNPQDLTVGEIMAEPNAEVTRLMIERKGWDWFVNEAGMKCIDSSPDPGNPGCTRHLFEVPDDVYNAEERVLVVTNGTPHRDGTVPRFGIPVPATLRTAAAASAWTFGVEESVYENLARRT